MEPSKSMLIKVRDVGDHWLAELRETREMEHEQPDSRRVGRILGRVVPGVLAAFCHMQDATTTTFLPHRTWTCDATRAQVCVLVCTPLTGSCPALPGSFMLSSSLPKSSRLG